VSHGVSETVCDIHAVDLRGVIAVSGRMTIWDYPALKFPVKNIFNNATDLNRFFLNAAKSRDKLTYQVVLLGLLHTLTEHTDVERSDYIYGICMVADKGF
jgi:hypothetical protein